MSYALVEHENSADLFCQVSAEVARGGLVEGAWKGKDEQVAAMTDDEVTIVQLVTVADGMCVDLIRYLLSIRSRVSRYGTSSEVWIWTELAVRFKQILMHLQLNQQRQNQQLMLQAESRKTLIQCISG